MFRRSTSGAWRPVGYAQAYFLSAVIEQGLPTRSAGLLVGKGGTQESGHHEEDYEAFLSTSSSCSHAPAVESRWFFFFF